jgi:hypothetical protein
MKRAVAMYLVIRRSAIIEKLVHKYLDNSRSSKSKGRAVPSAGNGSVPCRPPPGPLQGSYANGRGLNASFRIGCPRSPRLAPYVY